MLYRMFRRKTAISPCVIQVKITYGEIFRGKIRVKALFEPDQKWRLVEDFGPECFAERDDGRLLFTTNHTDLESLITWLMTFGDKAEVLEPCEAREVISQMAKKMAILYGDQ